MMTIDEQIQWCKNRGGEITWTPAENDEAWMFKVYDLGMVMKDLITSLEELKEFKRLHKNASEQPPNRSSRKFKQTEIFDNENTTP